MSETTEIIALLNTVIQNQSDRDNDRLYDAIEEIRKTQMASITNQAVTDSKLDTFSGQMEGYHIAQSKVSREIGVLRTEVTKITSGAGVIAAIVSMITVPILTFLISIF